MFEEWLLNGKEGDAVTLFEIFKTAPEDGSGAQDKKGGMKHGGKD